MAGSASAPATIFCKLCLSHHPEGDASTLHACGCVFCTQCLQQYVSLCVREGGGSLVTCPDPSCQATQGLSDSEVACYVSEEQLELYKRLKFEREVQLDPSKAWCPVIHCQAVCCVVPGVEGTPSPLPVPCPACHNIFCFDCKQPWQEGHVCSSSQPLTSEGDSSTDAPIKQCPMCGIYIERNQGCAQMLCKNCNHTFCWYCLQNLDGDIFLRHYDKGPCKYKLGHSRASVMWNRTQVVAVLVGASITMLLTFPFLLLASPCILCCIFKPCHGKKRKKKMKKNGKSVPSDQ
ncbi:E3 ubiquitin-protein ligase RNF144B [Alosa pseudoharengus]|uniref:E3 ubiquitin-protein ligase RNF144B n=1 Tax=Alosa pseudoharengus TaxID=34774 RepID=UPI003F886774